MQQLKDLGHFQLVPVKKVKKQNQIVNDFYFLFSALENH